MDMQYIMIKFDDRAKEYMYKAPLKVKKGDRVSIVAFGGGIKEVEVTAVNVPLGAFKNIQTIILDKK